MPPKKGRGGGAAGPKAHQLAEEMPQGEILNDLSKGRWRLGAKLGQGGFGLIYLATNADSKAEPTHVIKQEPAGNGPLALECLFYAGTMKPAKLEAWVKSKRISNLGLPKYVGWGMHTFKGKSNRFLVMDRFGADLQKLFLERGTFGRVAVAQMALRLIDSLHYLHDNRFVHADVKAANVLLPFSKAVKQPPVKTVYLVDFGLTAKFADGDGNHKPYKQDPRRAHDGTIELTSRDAHVGVAPSRRGDMEILGYCLVQWLCGRLPWEDKLGDKNYVADQKCKFMKDIPASMRRCFGSSSSSSSSEAGIPAEIQKYLRLVEELEYTEEPDYDQFKEVFNGYLRSRGISAEAPIDFGPVSSASASSSTSSSTPKRAAASKSSAAPPKSSSSAAPLKSSRASKNVVPPSGDSEDDDDVDDSMSTAFPPKKTPTKRAANRNKAAEKEEQNEEEAGGTTKLAAAATAAKKSKNPPPPAKSRSSASSSSKTSASSRLTASSSATSAASASSAASSSSSSRSSRKRTKAIQEEEEEEEEEVEETKPLKEVAMNNPEPRKKQPRLIKVRKNVKKTDGNTQTTPNAKRAKR